jgi:hypothetical protein
MTDPQIELWNALPEAVRALLPPTPASERWELLLAEDEAAAQSAAGGGASRPDE